jgi:hypothetical protein
LDVFEDFVAYDAGDHSSGGCNGRDDLTSDHLGLVAVAFRDGVVASAKVGASVNEVNMEVCVVILLKISGYKVTSQAGSSNLQLFKKSSDDWLIIVIASGASWGRTSSRLTFLCFFGSLNGDYLADILGGSCARTNRLNLSFVKRIHAQVGQD